MEPSGQPRLPVRARLGGLARRFSLIWRKEIWQTAHLRDSSWRGRFYASLRVISITWTVFFETRALSRAASLSFSALLGLGPMIAITVLIAGFTIDRRDPSKAVNALDRLITFVAPQIAQLEELDAQNPAAVSPGHAARGRSAPQSSAPADQTTRATPPTDTPAAAAAPGDNAAPRPDSSSATVDPTPASTRSDQAGRRYRSRPPPEANLRLAQILDGFLVQSRSGTAGILGVLTLIVIVLQLFTSVENAFNEIWGVRSGRTWLTRLVFYWTILTLGAVVFFGAVTGLTAGVFFNAFQEKVPFGLQMVALLRFLLPSISVLMLVFLLTLFYRYIPNTRVLWRAALIGAALVALLLLLNNFLAFLYLRRVVLNRSLYGSLALPLVLMSGLYFFWLYVLIGGQVSYAIQNVQFRNSQAAWSRLSESKRERFSLVLLLTICRRFQACLPPASAGQLSSLLKVPTQIINEALNRLVDVHLITPIPPLAGDAHADVMFQPARPLNRISLGEFKHLDDNLGDDVIGNIEHIDPIVQHYIAGLDHITRQPVFQKSLEDLLNEFPFDESRPPFAMGERAPRTTSS